MAEGVASQAVRAAAGPGPVLRLILLVHRYLGVAVGVLMTLWCLSGFVMMYQAYPALEDSERLAGLAPLDLTQCCEPGALRAAQAGSGLPEASPAPAFRIEMLDGDPVLRPGGRFRAPGGAVNLRTGEPVRELSADATRRVADLYARGHGIEGSARPLDFVDEDQWTVQSAGRNQPVHHFAFDDDAGTEIYVSAASGEVFQDTNRRERVLTWLGAIPHWLYPLQLRRNGALWTEIVIWTSVVGTFLAATGLYVGLMRFVSARRRNRVSPYRGWWYWHHVSGLVFGILTLTWVFSGLLTMSPWGVFDGAGGGHARSVRGEASWQELERFMAAAATLPPGEFVQIESAPFDGKLHVIATRTDGSRVRLDASAEPAPLAREDVERAVAKLAAPVAELELLHSEDSYYYGHKRSVDLPVYRAILDDPEQTRLYIETTSGSVRTVDSARRASRWFRTGLHDLDFAGLRERPVWDIVVGLLLAGVTLVCGTGTWMAVRRVRADARRFSRRYRVQQRGDVHAPDLP